MNFTTLIDVQTLATHLGSTDWVVLDCRFELGKPDVGATQYRQGHIAGAQYAHLDQQLAAPPGAATGRHPLPDPEAFAALAGAWGIDGGTQVVVYDQGGSYYAARAWWIFHWLGHSRTAVLDGGLAAWCAAGHALETTVTPPQPRAFTARPRDDFWVDAAAVLQASSRRVAAPEGAAADRPCIVDARGADRFSGENAAMDPIAGHVPGAVNHPYSRNYGSDGRMHDRAALRAQWLDTLGGAAPQAMIAMCGSGVSACVNLLAMTHAGLDGARLYPGSWSEWIRDPSRPVARGL